MRRTRSSRWLHLVTGAMVCHLAMNTASAQAPHTDYAATIVGLEAEQNPNRSEIMLKYRIDGTGLQGKWNHRVLGNRGVKNPSTGQIWKTSANYHRFQQNFYIEFYQLAPYKFLGSYQMNSTDPPGRKEVTINRHGIKLKLVCVKDNLTKPHTVRTYNGQYFPPESFSFFGNVREPVPPTVPVGQQNQPSCTAWAICAVLGTQVLNQNYILESGDVGFDRRGFMKKSMNVLDPRAFYAQRQHSGDGWFIDKALDRAKQIVIPFQSNKKYGVKVLDWKRVTNHDEARWLLSRGIPLVGDIVFTKEFDNFDGRTVFMGSVDETTINAAHSLAVIGYNDPWAGKQLGVPYWEVQNSWGTKWGRDGYFLIKPNQRPLSSHLDHTFYWIKNAVICEVASQRALSGSESNAIIKQIIGGERPKTDLKPSNIARAQLSEAADQFSVSVANNRSLGRKVSIRLQTPPNITWWKAIKIYRNGRQEKELWNQDNRHDSGTYTFTVHPEDRFQIEFCKAKAFGAHTPIKKHTIDFYQFEGQLITFRWTKD